MSDLMIAPKGNTIGAIDMANGAIGDKQKNVLKEELRIGNINIFHCTHCTE